MQKSKKKVIIIMMFVRELKFGSPKMKFLVLPKGNLNNSIDLDLAFISFKKKKKKI
jgi:hypothetical protein